MVADRLPVQDESLHYTMNWPSGLSLGEATLSARKSGDTLGFRSQRQCRRPGICRERRDSLVGHAEPLLHRTGARLQPRRQEDPREDHVRPEGRNRRRAPRCCRTAARAGKSSFDIPSLRARCADVPVLRAARIGAGPRCPRSTVFFGSAYTVSMDYTGAQNITVAEKTDQSRTT